jgi:dihydroxyacetone kinase
MSRKSLTNDVTSVVEDALIGLLSIDASLARIGSYASLAMVDIESYKKNHVTLISGGGSGHEPLHAGYIGHGMLSAAVLGNVFASPSVASILATIRVCAGPKGVLLIVKNYTGDRLNFGLAAELARSEGLLVKMVIVDDDVALEEGKGITGGRGIAGVIYVHKVAGAVAYDERSSLDDVYNAAVSCVKNVRSLGVALTTCTVPGGLKSDRLADDDIMEVGMGIHGEPGSAQITMAKNQSADQVADILVDRVLGRLAVGDSEKVAILLNNLGGLPHIELLIVAKKIVSNLKSRNIQVVRANAGYYCTSLEMAGLSLSILRIYDDSVLSYIDLSTTAPAWIKSTVLLPATSQVIAYSDDTFKKKLSGGPPCPNAVVISRAICESIIKAEPMLTKYDMICGDGDCGIVMKAGH